MSGALRPVLWLALGGTLQARGHDPGDRDRYWRTGRSVPAEELLTGWPDRLGPVVVEQVAAGASHDLEPTLILEIAARLRRLDPAAWAGVVISLGSNALEEVAFLLWLLGPAPVPVVVTAAMRPPTALGTDAQANLISALTVAAAGDRRGGTVVVSDGAVLHPVGLTKTHTASVDSFRAGGRTLGTVEPAGEIDWSRSGRPGPLADRPIPDRLAPVALLASHLGGEGTLVRAAVAGGVRALVSTGLGAGFAPTAERDALREAHDAGVAVCLARRTAHGHTVGAADTAPFLSAGALTALQARLVLAVALADSEEPDVVGLQDLLERCVS